MAANLRIFCLCLAAICLPVFASSSLLSAHFDPLGRPTEIKNLSDNSFLRITPGPKETLTEDESRTGGLASGIRKRIERNAAGWITRVVEDDGGSGASTTYYRYDAMGRLLGVCQAGTFDAGGNCSGRGRVFTYNQLGWLTSALNPESGTTAYTHDDNGNVLTRG